jgi:DNA modification methylase
MQTLAVTNQVISTNEKSMQVVEIDVAKIKTRIRLRTADGKKIEELAESIKTCGLLHPILVDTENYLIAGFHRWSAFKLLGYKTIPAFISNTSDLYNKLKEIDENLARNEIDHIEIASHIVEREKILEELGVRMPRGGNQYSEGMITTAELAEQLGITDRHYRLKRQPYNLHPEVKDALVGTSWAKNLMDMVKLSREPDEIQLRVKTLLLTGKCRTFKRAYSVASLANYRKEFGYKIDFDIKERWGIPQSIMKFKNADSDLQRLCDLITKSDELDLLKRTDFYKGLSNIPVYTMSADLAEFLVTYYTPEDGLVLDQFCGRGTIGLACLFHGRKFVGYDLTEKNLDLISKVMVEHLGGNQDNFTLHHSDGIHLREYADKSDYFDAIVTDPPFTGKLERYSNDDRELGYMPIEDYIKSIRINFEHCHRLIKKSNFQEKIFYPVIFKVSHSRKGNEGITDMDFEFQKAARDTGFTLHDKLTNQLHSPFASVNFQRNYIHKMVQKNYEVNLVFCKF